MALAYIFAESKLFLVFIVLTHKKIHFRGEMFIKFSPFDDLKVESPMARRTNAIKLLGKLKSV